MTVFVDNTGKVWRTAGGAAWTTTSGIQPLVITTTSPLTGGTTGIPYAFGMSATGGVLPYTWSLVSNTGTNSWVVTSFGSVTGTPTTVETDSLTIRVTDAVSTTTTGVFSITVASGAFTVPNITFTLGTPSSFQLTVPSGTASLTSIGTPIQAPIGLDSTNDLITYDGTGVVGTTSGYQLRALASLEADWQARISGTGVSWYHDFRSDSEVNAFRWTQSYGSGNDPLLNGNTYSGDLRRITTDGITGACMEIIRRPGINYTSPDWWRPMSALKGGTNPFAAGAVGAALGNGHNFDDPGVNGTLTRRQYSPTDGGSQISSWGPNGVYGNAHYQGFSVPGGTQQNDGNEFWLQFRFKMDPARTATPGNLAQNGSNGGKLLYITRTDKSLTSQEVNTIQLVNYGVPNNTTNYFSMYRSGGNQLWDDPPGLAAQGNQPGTQYGGVGDGVCSLNNANGHSVNNCWYWPPGQWVTMMYHFKEGTMVGDVLNGTANSDTLIEVLAAKYGETSFTRIWYQANDPLPYDVFFGHNAVLFTNWLENSAGCDAQFYQRYCQVILSQQPIPCPQVYA